MASLAFLLPEKAFMIFLEHRTEAPKVIKDSNQLNLTKETTHSRSDQFVLILSIQSIDNYFLLSLKSFYTELQKFLIIM